MQPGPDESPAVRSSTSACFLCPQDQAPCAVPRVEGRLLGARVDREGDRVRPFVGLITKAGERVRVNLGLPHLELIERLAELAPDQVQRLTLRALHLREGVATPAAGQEPFRVLHALPATLVILEPDLLVNITDLNHGNYCIRQDLLRKLVPSRSGSAGLRGTIIHNIFKEILKDAQKQPEPLIEEALKTSVLQLAEVNASEDEMREAILPHLHNLAQWRDTQQANLWSEDPEVRAETFLLAPEIGLKGRLDILWRRGDERRVLELKTGGARGELPKADHRWQIYGYQALLDVRYPASQGRHPMGTLIYSQAPDGTAKTFGIRGQRAEMQKVLALRNAIVLIRVTGMAPAPPGGMRCEKCVQRPACGQIAQLLGWIPPPGEVGGKTAKADAAWYRHWYALQQAEGRVGDGLTRTLWQQPVAARVEAGIAITHLTLTEPPKETERHEWIYQFDCDNTSELREGDEILLSDGDPVRGAVVSGAVLAVGSNAITIWAREYLPDPRLIDRYSTDVVTQRMLSNLYRWLSADERLRELVRGEARPHFLLDPPMPAIDLIADLNREQADAVIKALSMKDYLLIQGPPGTGKTKVIAAIAHALAKRGLRIALAAHTNQATDNMLARLIERGVTDVVRLGHEYAVIPELRPYRLLERVKRATGGAPTAERARALLQAIPVVAATVATWSSEAHEIEETMPRFNVVIVDEASQLTIPAAVGALRWAPKFILVGDERQLPPLVQDEGARADGLGESLFAQLQARNHPGALVALRRQYRMHAAIGAFPSQAFYNNALVPAPEVAQATLSITPARQRAILAPDRPLVWVEVVPLPGTSAKVNDQEAIAAAELADALIASGLGPAQIGIIAPFRAQVARIRQMAAEPVARGITVDTVDRFQGGERSVILLSLTATQPLTPESALGTFLADPHRLNVALTRARHKLIILGYRPAIAGLPLLRDLADHCERQAGGVVAWGATMGDDRFW